MFYVEALVSIYLFKGEEGEFGSQIKDQTHHLHTLHERQSDSHVSGQADHTCRSVWCGLQQSHHSLNTHPAGLRYRHKRHQSKKWAHFALH